MAAGLRSWLDDRPMAGKPDQEGVQGGAAVLLVQWNQLTLVNDNDYIGSA